MVRWTIGIERQCGKVDYRHGEAVWSGRLYRHGEAVW